MGDPFKAVDPIKRLGDYAPAGLALQQIPGPVIRINPVVPRPRRPSRYAGVKCHFSGTDPFILAEDQAHGVVFRRAKILCQFCSCHATRPDPFTT